MSPTNHHHHLPLTLLLSNLLLTSAIPALPPLDFNPSTLIIQPNTGGGQADDCGAGPITLDANTWNAQNMDSVIRNFWDAGVSRPNFDFHQEFADQYGVDLYCPNSFTNCEGDPSSCSQLKGTTAQKTQGWLGIKAMMSVQDMFLQWEKVVSNAADGLTTLVVDFQQVGYQTQTHGTFFISCKSNYFRNSPLQTSQLPKPAGNSSSTSSAEHSAERPLSQQSQTQLRLLVSRS